MAFTASPCLCWLLSFLSFSGLCLFFLFWLLSFLPIMAYVFSSCSGFCLSFFLSNIIGKCPTFFIPFFGFFVFHFFFHLHLFIFHSLPLTSFHFPFSSTNIFSCSTLFHLLLFKFHSHKNVNNLVIFLYLGLQWILGWILDFLLLCIYLS